MAKGHQQDEARRRIEAVKHQLATMLATPIVAARFRFSKATGFQPRQWEGESVPVTLSRAYVYSPLTHSPAFPCIVDNGSTTMASSSSDAIGIG